MKLPSLPKLGKSGKGAAGADAPKQPAKQKKVATRGEKEGGLKLPFYAVAIFVPALLLFAAVPGAVLLLDRQAAQAQLEDQAGIAARAVRAHVDAGLAPALAVADTVVSGLVDPGLFVPERDAERTALAEELLGRFPGAKRVRLLPAGYDTLEQEADPPISYADLEQFRAVEAAPGKPAPLEVYQFGTPQKHINLVRPVVEGSGEAAAVRGLLVVGYDLGLAQAALRGANVKGFAQLVQVAGGKDLVVASLGDSAHKEGTTGPAASEKVRGTQWSLRYWPEAGAIDGLLLPPEQLAAVYGLALLLFAVVLYLVLRSLAGAIRQDQATVIKLVKELVERTGRNTYPVRLASFRAMVKVITGLSPRLTAAAQQAAAPAAVPAAPAASADQAAPAPASAGAAPAPKGKSSPLSSLFDDLDLPDLGGEAAAPAATAAAAEEVAVPGSIFRAYDIRGVVGSTLNAGIARQVGRAIGSAALDRGQQTVVVGRDGRLSGPQMLDALASGLQASGRDVVDIGLVPTPVLYFATHHLGTATGVMVTGSHNPPDYNGFKIVLDSEALHGQAIKALHQRLESGDLASGNGGKTSEAVTAAYIDRIVADVHLSQPLKVVIDCGNGAAGAVAPDLYRTLGCEVMELFCEVDGQFPNHHPDPGKAENLADLVATVKAQNADLGLAFDGDGDRLGVVDGHGRIIWPDRLMMLFARDLLSRHPDAEILFDVKCSRNLASVIKQSGGRPSMCRTGHSLIKARMRETGALLAGEMSGHFFFAERWFGFDDGLYAGARLLEILSGQERPSHEVFAGLPDSLGTPEINVAVPDGAQHGLVERMVAQADFPGAEVTTLDGLRVDFPDSWGLVRASNTTPNLVLRFEGDTKEALGAIQERFRQLLQAVEPGLKLTF